MNRKYYLDLCISNIVRQDTTYNSAGSRGGSGGPLEPPPCPPFINILKKLNNLVSMRPKEFHFHGIFKKNEIRSANRTTAISTHEPPFQKSWTRPCTNMQSNILTFSVQYIVNLQMHICFSPIQSYALKESGYCTANAKLANSADPC